VNDDHGACRQPIQHLCFLRCLMTDLDDHPPGAPAAHDIHRPLCVVSEQRIGRHLHNIRRLPEHDTRLDAVRVTEQGAGIGGIGEVEHDINEMRLRRRGVEGSLEASIQALYHALEFIRDQDKPEEKVLLHRPRPAEAPAPQRSVGDVPRTADERG